MAISDVTYIDAQQVGMQSFIDAPEKVPRRVEIADLETVLETAVQKLFELDKDGSFATFNPPPNYSLKELFKRQILPSIVPDEAINIIDEIEEELQSERLLTLLYTVVSLEDVLKEIRAHMLSIVKS